MSWMQENDDNNDLTIDFNTSEVEVDSFEVLPAGQYEVVIKKIEAKQTKDKGNGPGKQLVFQLAVAEGEHKGRTVFDRVTTVNANPQAVAIGKKQIAAIATAIGKLGETDLRTFIGESCLATISVDPPRDGFDAQNRVKKYAPLGGAPAPTAKAPTAGVATGARKPPAFIK